MISERARQVKPFIVMDVMEKARDMESKGKDVIHLEVGEPDFQTPSLIVDAAVRAMREGKTQYTHSLGLPELREGIAAYYRERYHVDVSHEQILVTAGTSPAMMLLFSVLIESGDSVILSNPHYASYPYVVRFFDGKPVFVPVREEDRFQFVPGDVKKSASKGTRAILINSPANPTGSLLEPERMKEIADIGPIVVSDEIYHGLVYEGREHSILEYTENACVINGFSKLYAMTGWRLGYLIVPKKMARTLQKIHQNFFICANAFVQWAALTALTDKRVKREVEMMRVVYDIRRKVMVALLKEIGFGVLHPPGGAFYVFANASRFTKNSYEFAMDILEKARVALTPGIDFGSEGEGYIRFSYATSLENINEGIKRLSEYLQR